MLLDLILQLYIETGRLGQILSQGRRNLNRQDLHILKEHPQLVKLLVQIRQHSIRNFSLDILHLR